MTYEFLSDIERGAIKSLKVADVMPVSYRVMNNTSTLNCEKLLNCLLVNQELS
jgi:hypothetical protein